MMMMMMMMMMMITGEILRLAGEPTLNYLLGIDEGKLDYICRIPREAQIRIILNMDLEDIQRLGRTCKKFREVRIQARLIRVRYYISY